MDTEDDTQPMPPPADTDAALDAAMKSLPDDPKKMLDGIPVIKPEEKKD